MTILTAAQSAIARLVGRRPAAVVSAGDDEIAVEITALAQEAAVDIAKAHDWTVLTRLQTVIGNGTDQGFPMPLDYDRMTLAGEIFAPSWPDWRFTRANSLAEWNDALTREATLSPGWWIILDGQFRTQPSLGVGEEARFYYITSNVFADAGGAPKATITRDDDSFRLDERLLTLSLIWRWKQMKQMEYGEDMRNYEIALSQEMARDGGSRTIVTHSPHRFRGAVNAWPWSLG